MFVTKVSENIRHAPSSCHMEPVRYYMDPLKTCGHKNGINCGKILAKRVPSTIHPSTDINTTVLHLIKIVVEHSPDGQVSFEGQVYKV